MIDAKVGYEYAGRTYTTQGFLHNTVGGNNPCVGCHMQTNGDHKSHTLEATISNVCSSCHAMDATTLEESKDKFASSMEALRNVLLSKGIHFKESSPYFFTISTATLKGSKAYTKWGTAYGNSLAKKTMGAAFNYNVLEHEPGAFAHNRQYATKLVYDSIDFADDGVLNNSVEATINTLQTYNSEGVATGDFPAADKAAAISALFQQPQRHRHSRQSRLRQWQPDL